MVYIVGSVTGYFISVFESALLFPLVGILRSDLNTHYIFSRYRPRSAIVLENREDMADSKILLSKISAD